MKRPRIHWSLSRFDEALPELEAELRINPNHPEALYEIAEILQVRGRNAQAKERLLESLRQKPDLVEARLAIERIYFAEAEFDKALDQMRTVVRLSPADPRPHYRMSMLYRKLGKTQEARKELQEFQRLQAR
jgi:tetratricopeptide (TPR) repeat protein